MDPKTVVLASDHAGYSLKNALRDYLASEGYAVIDAGTDSSASCDSPVYAEKACRILLAGDADLALLVCGTGVGMSLAANKIPGVRAACCSDVYTAKFTRLHNDANALCLGARVLGEGLAREIADIFVSTEFEGGKHARRVDMIRKIEAGGTLLD